MTADESAVNQKLIELGKELLNVAEDWAEEPVDPENCPPICAGAVSMGIERLREIADEAEALITVKEDS
jgi:hypothetical protein